MIRALFKAIMLPKLGEPTVPADDPVPVRTSLVRYRLTAGERVFFVYARDEGEAVGRLRSVMGMRASSAHPAGYVDSDGVVHVPDDELSAVMRSTRDERIAPGG